MESSVDALNISILRRFTRDKLIEQLEDVSNTRPIVDVLHQHQH